VQWCGDIAHAALKKAGVDVPVTMCNGETASNAINTCNNNDCSGFLEQHGQNGRVLVDQPALWTENEGGFQTWGGAPPPGGEPYFWGRSIADQSLSVMKWFARGGSHMNYYMWTGGNNYGRWTGDGITHMCKLPIGPRHPCSLLCLPYDLLPPHSAPLGASGLGPFLLAHFNGRPRSAADAVDAIVCPDGHRHEPKFSHTAAMHNAISASAAHIASAEPQLDKARILAPGVKMYAYPPVAFVENTNGEARTVHHAGHAFTVSAGASALVNLETGKVLFDSGTVTAAATAAPRKEPPQHDRAGRAVCAIMCSGVAVILTDLRCFVCASFEPLCRSASGRNIKPLQSLSGWTQWFEPIESAAVKPGMYPPASVFASATPIEMTNLTSALTTYAFYETELPASLVLKSGSILAIPTHNAMAFVAFVDGKEVSAAAAP